MKQGNFVKISESIPSDDDDHDLDGDVYVDFSTGVKIEHWKYVEFVYDSHFYFHVQGEQYRSKDFDSDREALIWLKKMVDIHEI